MVILSVRSIKYIQAGCFAASILTANAPARAASEKLLYSFKGGSDGSGPVGGLIYVHGAFDGTTHDGGSANCTFGCGTVFKVTKEGAETVLYSFQGGRDGYNPVGRVIRVGETLYGTTQYGGSTSNCSLGCGTLFKLTKEGVKKQVYLFRGSDDGASPTGPLINVGGTLYGTTASGGPSGCGTVYKVTLEGVETVVYSFKCGSDGNGPTAGLTEMDGTFYGTTAYGGDGHCDNYGCGTVFSITQAGAETVVHSFLNGSDGSGPFAGLVSLSGTLYGTTTGGGATDRGIAFKVTKAGHEKVLHSFGVGSDGTNPSVGLNNLGGALYGDTEEGGAYGYGLVYEITRTGAETVVYSFKDGSDGAYPNSVLLNVGGTLYGTIGGGASNSGGVFALTP